MVDIGQLIPRHARYRSDHTALVVGDVRLSYRELGERVNRLASALAGLGLRPGDRVATLMPNRRELVEIYWACAVAGLVCAPLSPLLRGRGVVVPMRDADVAAVVADAELSDEVGAVRGDLPGLRHHIRLDPQSPGEHDYETLLAGGDPATLPRPPIDADTVYNIMYSSGTTGEPKGIVLTHGIRAAYGQGFAAEYRITPESVIAHSGSLVFNGAFLTFMPAFHQGATYVLLERFDPEALLDTIEREGVTHTMMVPAQIVALLASPAFHPDRLRSLQMLGSVGAPLHLHHKEALQRLLPGRLSELYGVTEGFVTILDTRVAAHRLASVGAPPPLYDMRIVDTDGHECPTGVVGEITGRGPITMVGYHGRPDLTAEAMRGGFLHTGDLGSTDEDGYLHLVDRKKDMIVSGGMNVYPRDIEEVAVRHPEVAEAAVLGVPDARWGETPVAAVVLVAGATDDPAAIRDWINDRVDARYQRVAAVVVYENFPRSAAGKTLKRVMRDEIAAHRDEPG